MLVGISILTLLGVCSCDDSWTSGSAVGIPHALKIPFCRRGHGQMNAVYIDQHSGEKKNGIMIFGGDGINYEQPSPGSSFLQDLWILSVAKGAKGDTPDQVDQGFYTHSWSRIVEESSSGSSTGNILTPNNAPSLWPGRRWNFGHTVTEHGWFLIYGGEDAGSNIHYDDTWVFFQNKWIKLQAFGGGQTGFGPQTGLGPGRRKGLSLLLMPISGLVILWGGQRPPVGGGKRQGKDFSRALMSDLDTDSENDNDTFLENNLDDKLHYWDDAHESRINYFTDSGNDDVKKGKGSIKRKWFSESGHLGGNSSMNFPSISGAGMNILAHVKNKSEVGTQEGYVSRRGRGRGPYVQCLSDTYIFNATAALFDATEGVKHPEQPSNMNHLNLDTWRRVADFPGSCLYGATAVGILDPSDSREKLFTFGGRYRAGFGSIKDDANANTGYLLSNDIWYYDPLSDIWTKVGRDITKDFNWPQGRDKHAMAYVAELDTVFVSGGRLSDPNINSGHDNNNDRDSNNEDYNEYEKDKDKNKDGKYIKSNNSNESNYSNDDNDDYDDDSRGKISMTDMDLWGYNLITRKWSQYGDSDSDLSDYDDDNIASIEKREAKVRIEPFVEVNNETEDQFQLTNKAEKKQKSSSSRSSSSSSSNSNSNSNGKSQKGGNDANNNNKWWVGVAGDLPAARYQHGLSVWRGWDGTDKPYLICFGGERSDTPWQLKGGIRDIRSTVPGKSGRNDNKYLRREREIQQTRIGLNVKVEMKMNMKMNMNKVKDFDIIGESMKDNTMRLNIVGESGLEKVIEEGQKANVGVRQKIEAVREKKNGINVDMSEATNREIEREDKDEDKDKDEDMLMVPSADQVAIDDDSFSGNANYDENDGGGGGGSILGPVSSHAQSNDLWLLPLRNGINDDEREESGVEDSEDENMINIPSTTLDSLYWDRDDDNVEDENTDNNYNKEKNDVGHSNTIKISSEFISHTDDDNHKSNFNNRNYEISEQRNVDISSSGGDSGSHKGKGPGRGNAKGDNPRRHRPPPHNNSSSVVNSNTKNNSSNNGNTDDKNKKDRNGSRDGDIDNWNSNDKKGDGWTLLSAGGCHYLDDGSQNDRSVDVSALAIVGSFLMAILFGLLCYQLMRNGLFNTQVLTPPIFDPEPSSSLLNNQYMSMSISKGNLSQMNLQQRNSNSNLNFNTNSRSNSNSNLNKYTNEFSNSLINTNSMINYNTNEIDSIQLPSSTSQQLQLVNASSSSSSVLQYLPVSLIPNSFGSRLRGYTDISDMSMPAHGQERQSFHSPQDSIGSIQTKSDIDNFEYENENESEHKLELKRTRKKSY